MQTYGLIGYGAIGASIAELWETQIGDAARLGAILARPHQVEEGRARMGPDTLVTADADEFLAQCGDRVIEAASHEAVRLLGARILEGGRDFLILSVGALASETVRLVLEDAAARGRSRLIILPGALAGFDGLLSMRAGNLQSVKYISSKPFHAWEGTPGEALLPKEAAGPVTIFDGYAADVCRLYPKNANLAAAVAFAGLGLEQTEVELIADPSLTGNKGHLLARSDTDALEVICAGEGFGANPKSSRITAHSVVAAIADSCRWMGFS